MISSRGMGAVGLSGAVRAGRVVGGRIGGARAQRGALLAPVFTVALAVILAGCGSGESVTSKSAAEILAASRAAALSASSVHVLTKVSIGKHQVANDDQELAGDGGRAKLSLVGRRYEAIRIGNTVYVKGGPAFYRTLERRTGAHVPEGAWVKAPADSAQLAQFAYLTDLSKELGFQLRSNGSLTKGAITTIEGQKAIELKDTAGKRSTRALYVATTGKPYPLQIVRHGVETAQTTFTGWNRSTQLTAPAGAVELAGLEKAERDG